MEKMKCNHKNATIEKYEVGCGYYGFCPDCNLIGAYANTKEEAGYNFTIATKGAICSPAKIPVMRS